MKRLYRDHHGQTRTLTYIEDVPWLVTWLVPQPGEHKNFSTAKRWLTEDGSQIQIPDDVWCKLVKEWQDEI